MKLLTAFCLEICIGQVVEPTTGMTFPGALEEGRLFTGAGLRKKSIFGLKKINVYTYGNCYQSAE